MTQKIKVPEGMIEATEKAWMVYVADDIEHRRIVLEYALRWLLEQKELQLQSDPYSDALRSESMGEYDRRSGRNKAVADMRKMFIGDEPRDNPVVRGVVDRFRGVTLTRDEANYIIDQINMVTHG